MDKRGIERQQELYKAQKEARQASAASKNRAHNIVGDIADEHIRITGTQLIEDLISRLEKLHRLGVKHPNVAHKNPDRTSIKIDESYRIGNLVVGVSKSSKPILHYWLSLENERWASHEKTTDLDLGMVSPKHKDFFLEDCELGDARGRLIDMFEIGETVGVVEEAAGIEQPFTAEGFLGQLAVSGQASA